MLLDKFEFIPPENDSGYYPANGAVRVLKKSDFQYVDLGTIIGDAPKCMIALYSYEKNSKSQKQKNVRKANPRTWRKYIAKSASKWYPNESITEHLLNELGRALGLNMANSCIRRINNQVWFLSEYFLKEGFSLYHGADFYALHLDTDIAFVDDIQNDNKTDDQDYFTIQFVDSIFKTNFSNDSSRLFEEFIRMVVFDGIIGNNDRHSYNWGVVTSIKPNEPSCFSPIYDTARGLYWNSSEKEVERILTLTDKQGNNPKIKKYVLLSRPKIGWNGKSGLSHIQLLELIYSTETGISKENFVNLVSQANLNICLHVINTDFRQLFSENRRRLMSECLTLRFQEINNFINK